MESKQKTIAQPWAQTRIGKVLLFVGIVWSIAGAFLVLDIGVPEVFDRAIKAGWFSDKLTMPGPSKPDAARKCDQQNEATSLSLGTSQEARHGSWKMGYRFGFAAGRRNARSASEPELAELMKGVEPFAQALNVPAPILPEIHHSTNALHEFATYIEVDEKCTAASLARIYEPRVASLYKLGVVIGHATVYRILCPECGALFVPQIRHHAESAGVPQELWLPFTKDIPKNEPPDEVKQKTMMLIDSINKFVETSR